MSNRTEIPRDAVEAAARSGVAFSGGPAWGQLSEQDRDRFREIAAHYLRAALPALRRAEGDPLPLLNGQIVRERVNDIGHWLEGQDNPGALEDGKFLRRIAGNNHE